MNRIQSADFKLFVNKQLTGHDPEAELLITDQLCPVQQCRRNRD